jgi:hypothetical protein
MTFIQDPREIANLLGNLFADAGVSSFRYSRGGFTLDCFGRGPIGIELWTEDLELVKSHLLVEWKESSPEVVGADWWRDEPAKAAAVAAIVERPILGAVLEADLSMRLEFEGGCQLRAPSSADPQSELSWEISVSSAGTSWGTCVCDGSAVFMQRGLADHLTRSGRS